MEAQYGLNRREFLRGAAAGALTLLSTSLHLRPAFAAGEEPRGAVPYRGYEDVYRTKWSWDSVGVGTHSCTNCASGGCAWDLYVREGIVWREEQGAPYTQTSQQVPDCSPRGCQKGASASALMQSPARLRHPLRRIGARGSGHWKRITWDEALDEVARSLVDTLSQRGGAGAYVENGNNSDFGPSWISMVRFFNQLGIPMTDNFGGVGDLPAGATEVFGIPVPGGSSDDWFRTDYFVNWFGNPISTRIPDAHYIAEARYRGAKIVSITPDFSPSAIHADLWIGLRPGTDAALALAACRVVVDEKLYDRDYILEQTDLPLLVRADTRQHLTEADVVAGGSRDRHAWWDEKRRELVWSASSAGSAQRTLRLGPDDHPALEPEKLSITLASGQSVGVRTVFSSLREKLADHDVDTAAKITGVAPDVIRRFAREFAKAKAAMIYSGAAQFKIYHGELVTRAQILLAALTGNNGRPGGGWHSMTFFELDGKILAALAEHPCDLSRERPEGVWQALGQIGQQQAASPAFISGYLLSLLYGGLRSTQLDPAYGDPTLPRRPEQYLEEAIASGNLLNLPPPEIARPDLIFNLFGNPFRNCRMGERRGETLFKHAKLIVDLSLRMDETARHSDLLLPVPGPYEKMGFKYSLAYPPYLHLGDRAVEPLGEAKPEWEIFSLLAERVSREARRRKISQVKGYRGVPFDLRQAAERFSDGGRLGPADQEKVMRLILALSPATQGITLEALRENKGAMRYTGVSVLGRMWCGTTDYRSDEPLVPFQDMVVKKQPWPTSTGRQQFYMDHPFFLEVGEELPVHKEPPLAGGAHPFTLTCGHTRWSIHTVWRDLDLLLQLQRGEPVIFVNPDDARARGLADGDYAGIFNDLGEFVSRVKLTAGMRPGQVHIYHAWDTRQFLTGRTNDSICPSPIKVTQLAGNHAHLRNEIGWFEPTQNDRDTRVDLRSFEPAIRKEPARNL